MKIFVEPEGKFAVKIPIEWEYRNSFLDSPKETPHSFELYNKPIGCFQISCHNKNIGETPKLIVANELKSQDDGKENLKFTEKVFLSNGFDMYLWMALVKDDFIWVKYIYNSNKRDTKVLKRELEKVRKALRTIIYVKPENRKSFLATDRFDKFMTSIAASIDLRNRAYENASFIELVILIANHIDALLRLSLILTFQIKNKTDEIDTSLLYQGEGDKPVMEKNIYKLALDENVITRDLYDELFDLYNDRNKVVHRYIITDIKTRDVIRIVIDYGKLQGKIDLIVKELEQEQFNAKVGIYGIDTPPNNPPDEIGIERIIANIKDKHGNREFNKNITIKK